MNRPYVVAVVGARHGKARASKEDEDAVRRVLLAVKARHGENVCIVTMGANAGIGELAKRLAFEFDFIFAEYCVHFYGSQRGTLTSFYVARHPSLLYVCQEFHIFLANRNSSLEMLIADLQAHQEFPYAVYDSAYEIVEGRGNVGAARPE